MARFIVLDTGPLGDASKPRGKPEAGRCLRWLDALASAHAVVVIPEIADYELRRELLRTRTTAGIKRLDRLRETFLYDPITTAVMHLAARLWAESRRRGLPTSDPHALDGDVILAAQAALLAGAGDSVVVATTNPRHLGRFVDARDWATIT